MTAWIFNLSFLALISILIWIDLRLPRNGSYQESFKKALIWSFVWIGLSVVFGFFIWQRLGSKPAVDFFTGYLVEKSLSVDNIFVFIVIFNTYRISLEQQHIVLMWGILGAVVLRGLFIFIGSSLLQHFHWVFYVFGLFLILTAVKLAFSKGQQSDYTETLLLKLCKRIFPVTHTEKGTHFFIRKHGKQHATPLFLALLSIESADVIFAIDSIPAIFAITTDPYIVYTSNIFAILGLRSLYFLLASLVEKFHYFYYGVAFILGFVGFKMLIHPYYPVSSVFSLCVIAMTLGISILFSLLQQKKNSVS